MTQIHFYKTYGANGYDHGFDVIQLESDSSYIMTGSSSSSGPGPSQVVLTQVDKFGNYLTSRFYGGSRSDIGVKILFQENVGYWIAGYSNSFSSDANFDFYLIHLNEDFEVVWERTYGSDDWERLYDATLLPDGGILLVGETEGLTTMEKDAYILRTDANGEILWQQAFAGPGDEIAFSSALFDNNSFLIAGKWGIASSNAWLAKFDLEGAIIWNNYDYLFSEGVGEFKALVKTDDYIYLAGSYVPTGQDADLYRPYRVMCDLSGNVILEHFESSVQESYASFCLVEQDQLLFAVQIDNPSFVGVNGPRTALFRFNEFLNWGEFGFTVFGSKVHPKKIIRTLDGRFALTGFTEDPGITTGGSNMFLLKIDATVSSLEVVTQNQILALDSFDEAGFSIFPNPTTNILNILLPQDVIGSVISVTDASGKLVMTESYTESLDFSNLNAGTYQLLIITNKGVLNMRILVQ